MIPKNGENDVKAGVVKEHVELSRESCRRMKLCRAEMSELTKLIAAAAY